MSDVVDESFVGVMPFSRGFEFFLKCRPCGIDGTGRYSSVFRAEAALAKHCATKRHAKGLERNEVELLRAEIERLRAREVWCAHYDDYERDDEAWAESPELVRQILMERNLATGGERQEWTGLLPIEHGFSLKAHTYYNENDPDLESWEGEMSWTISKLPVRGPAS